MSRDDLYAFEISLHNRPPEAVQPSEPYADAWGTWPTVTLPREMLAVPMAIPFDEAIDRLGRLERMYAEPDGSFVWVSRREGISWQVDGNVFDRGGRVVLVDMKGNCPPTDFDRLLTCFGWPEQPLIFHVMRPSIFLEEAVFRSHAAARGAVPRGETLRA